MTEMELIMEQNQQGTSYEVLVSAEGVEELKRKVKIKGEKKEALLTLKQKLDDVAIDIGDDEEDVDVESDDEVEPIHVEEADHTMDACGESPPGQSDTKPMRSCEHSLSRYRTFHEAHCSYTCDQLEKQLDKEEFQEIGSMASFKIPEFHDTLIQHMESVKKSIDERAKHKQEYNSWVNKRQMQTTEDKVDSSKALDASLVDTESSGTTLKEQDTSSRSGNDAHADDAVSTNMNEEPMAEVQTTAEINIFATGQQHTEQPEFNNEGKVDQNAEQCHDTCPLPAKLTDNQTTELSNQSLESKNIRLKKTVA
ncbi:hypothetical protein Tco_1228410 [Tanacetum coccineum]